MMFKLAEALGRLAEAMARLTRVAGFTVRIDTLDSVLKDIDKGDIDSCNDLLYRKFFV
jgi:hypothetical protein